MSSRSRRRFQRIALVVIGCLLVLIGGRQLAYAASTTFGDRCERDGHRFGYYVDDVGPVDVDVDVVHERTRQRETIRVYHDDGELHIIRE
ncbi:MAG TPA: hypothetical protein EYQ24_15700 [Bacteroidetes bacterium]|nr:hypothetical protein [Bacteroidota bacterium]